MVDDLLSLFSPPVAEVVVVVVVVVVVTTFPSLFTT